jgi:hypothetical protein
MTEIIMNIDLNKKLTIEETVRAAFTIYGLNPTVSFVEQYLNYFSGVDESELRAAISMHIETDADNAPVQLIIASIIDSQERPENEDLH